MPFLTAKVATGALKESETQGPLQNTSQIRTGAFVGLISARSHTFVPLTNTQVKSDATSFNQDGDKITCWKYRTPCW